MTDSHVHPDEQSTADPALAKAELAMAKLVDRQYEHSGRNGQFAALIVIYAVSVITGVGFRLLVIPQGWQVAVACALVAVLTWALLWLSRASGSKPPEWAASAEICEEALKDRIPAPTMTVVSAAIDRIRQRDGRRWHRVYVYLRRCTSSGPPDSDMCQNAGVLPLHGRLLVVIGEHMTTVPPQITASILAHESRHVTPVRMYLFYLISLSRIFGWAILGWAVPWPALLPAVLTFHIATTLLFWVIETGCDLGGAAEVGPGAMLATLDHLKGVVAQINKYRSRRARYTSAALIWTAGPVHPPFPLRRLIVGVRWPQASARDGG